MSHIRGRFEKEADKSVLEYTESVRYDWRLYRQDIAGSIAHAKMLARQHIIEEGATKDIIQGLEAIRDEIEEGKFHFDTKLEDIHMNIESSLIDKIGVLGKKLHTARSRNDQVALDLRLYVKEKTSESISKLRELQSALISLAEKNKEVIMPGYTHLQPAQPVLFAHHLLAYFEMLQRDIDRFRDCLKRVDVMPLGSGAVAGVTYNIDREFLARELGFSQISLNSIDAVSDRDFVLDYETAASICMMHLSRLAEEIIVWSSQEFGYIELDDAYATGSSIMPQKKNPDIAELARGKTGRIYGRLMAMLTTMKALPLSYNRDLQEDKEGLFDSIDTLLSTLEVFSGMVSTIIVRRDNIDKTLKSDYILATDLADYLVRKGEAFRSAHNAVASLVAFAEKMGKLFSELSIEEYQRFSPLFKNDVYSITIDTSLAARNGIGGTAPTQVERSLKAAKRILDEDKR